MPGFSFIYRNRGDLGEIGPRVSCALDSIVHFDHYRKAIISEDRRYILASTAYEEYPMSSFEDARYLICLEGQIYGRERDSVKVELVGLAKMLCGQFAAQNDELALWLMRNDGDYVIFIRSKSDGRMFFINDALGRLPLYYHQSEGNLLVSREARFISGLMKEISFDRMAFAQYLLFKYQLGERTLIKGMQRLKPAMLVEVRPDTGRIETRNVFQFDFGEKKYERTNVKDNAANLVSLFNEACRSRASSTGIYKNILALSGGLDSRAVGGALRNVSLPFSGVTMLDFDNFLKMDAKIAEQLAVELNIDWRLFSLKAPKGRDFSKLLDMKGGLNYLGMSFILGFFDEIRNNYGDRVIYLTGDGGQVLKPELRADSKKLHSLDELVDYAIRRNKLFSLKEVSELTKVSEGEILDELRGLFSSYPETGWNDKYCHFMIYEENVNHCFEGEDRNRYYFRSSAPFYSMPFFRYAMGCPDRQVAGYSLLREFLTKLSPGVARIDYDHWMTPITSKKVDLILMYHRLPAKLKMLIRGRVKGAIKTFEDGSSITNCFRDQVKSCGQINEYFDSEVLQSMITNCSKQHFTFLFTLTSAIENLTSNRCSIQDYSEADFS